MCRPRPTRPRATSRSCRWNGSRRPTGAWTRRCASSFPAARSRPNRSPFAALATTVRPEPFDCAQGRAPARRAEVEGRVPMPRLRCATLGTAEISACPAVLEGPRDPRVRAARLLLLRECGARRNSSGSRSSRSRTRSASRRCSGTCSARPARSTSPPAPCCGRSCSCSPTWSTNTSAAAACA